MAVWYIKGAPLPVAKDQGNPDSGKIRKSQSRTLFPGRKQGIYV
jgi:hypothetical protein